MLFIEGHCPHCNEKRGFNLFAVSDYRAKRNEAELKNLRHHSQNNNLHPAKFFAAGVCVYCNMPILADVEVKDAFLLDMRDCICNAARRYDGPPPEILHIYPEPTPPYSHPSLPEEINRDLADVQTMLKQNLSPHFIISGCRGVLETAVKMLGGEGGSLVKRILDLKEKAVVSGVLADWADHIRLEGNSATHERTGTEEEAREIMEFTKLFLQYTFEFPSRIKELRMAKPDAPAK